jgi:polyphosphate kinase
VPADDKAKGAQETLMAVAERRLAAAGRHKERKMRSRLLRHFQWRLRGKDSA